MGPDSVQKIAAEVVKSLPGNQPWTALIVQFSLTLAVDQKAAIIVVTHDEMILDRFDHIFRLRDGRLETGATVGLQPKSATVN